ncbi:MAG: STELLO glycosyltransferase family protein [Trichodesmium sp. St11_bin5]|nr:STELLO glycosyltransferase family protein [Trichodesmium sp. St11_bin5]
MNSQIAIVITSIASHNNKVLQKIAEQSQAKGLCFIVIGDEASPSNFNLEGCDFYDLVRQESLELNFPKICPKRHYARKNIGYLLAIQQGAEIIIETDDDNIPYESFWKKRERSQIVPSVSNLGWCNIYKYFTDANIWPRGLPLDEIHSLSFPNYNSLEQSLKDCPIQQGLANENPDVDAIYRLILPLPQAFKNNRRIALASSSWCPFNSQNTTWWADAYPLLYLPAYCSFRMTDIWRSFIAQRIAWENGWSVLFHEPTVYQERNEHNLMRDFQEEIPGYIHNSNICQTLENLNLSPGLDKLSENLLICYEKLISLGVIDQQEINLLEVWLEDLKTIQSNQ